MTTFALLRAAVPGSHVVRVMNLPVPTNVTQSSAFDNVLACSSLGCTTTTTATTTTIASGPFACAAAEGDECACNGVVLYGQKFMDKGSGIATFSERRVADSGSHVVRVMKVSVPTNETQNSAFDNGLVCSSLWCTTTTTATNTTTANGPFV